MGGMLACEGRKTFALYLEERICSGQEVYCVLPSPSPQYTRVQIIKNHIVYGTIYIIHLIHDLLFLLISTVESAVGKRLITHCCISRDA